MYPKTGVMRAAEGHTQSASPGRSGRCVLPYHVYPKTERSLRPPIPHVPSGQWTNPWGKPRADPEQTPMLFGQTPLTIAPPSYTSVLYLLEAVLVQLESFFEGPSTPNPRKK